MSEGNEDPSISEYALELDVDYAAERWSGSVAFEARPLPSVLRLDAEDLEILRADVDGHRAKFELPKGEHRLAIHAPAPGAAGRVRIEFAGRVDPKSMVGLYRTRFGDGYALVSQCEAIGARRIFPCLDRPDRKAPIRLTLTTDASLDVVSNTRPTRVDAANGRKTWRFEPSPSMATYLFFVGIGRFAKVEDRAGPVAISAYTAPGRESACAFSLSAARRVLEAFERYYGLPYPLPKLDLIGVPEHPFAAMENWGAITFRDSRLLVDERSSTFDRRFTYQTIAHEIAHQWFGNLVTMREWTDIWLNESFATLMEMKVIDQLNPETRPIQEFFQYWSIRAFRSDSLASVKPVRVAIAHPEEIAQAFDPSVSYGKGASVLRMIDGFLGEEAFRAGVTDYLHRFQWKNARTEDLWEALARASGQPIPEIVGPWIDRPGLPLLTARRTAAGLELTQQRFLQDGAHRPGTWFVPIVAEVAGRTERFSFDTERTVRPVPPEGAIHLNVGARGFYRVLYDPALYEELLRDFSARPMEDRFIVLEDLAGFVLSGDVPFATFAKFARAQSAAEEYAIVTSVVGALRQLSQYAPSAVPILDLARSFLADQFRRLGPTARPGEPGGSGIAREVVSLSRAAIDEGFARELSERFPSWEKVDPDLRAAVAVGRSRTEGALAHREILHRLQQHPPEGEESRLSNALGWSSDPALVSAALDLGLAGTLNKGHVWTLIIEAGRNPASREVTWRWLTGHVEELNAFFHGAEYLSQALHAIIPLIGVGREAEVRRFFAGSPYPEATRGAEKGLEMLTIAERFARRVGSGAY